MRFSLAASLIASIYLAFSGGVTAQIAFEPVAVAHHSYVGGWEHFVGGGVAVFDCNNDKMPDLLVAGGEAPSRLYKNTSQEGQAVSLAPLLDTGAEAVGVVGAYPINLDGDLHTDLVVLRVGKNVLLKGQGDCKFTPFTTLGFESADRWTTAFSATWEAGTSLPTLAFGNYVDRKDPEGPFGTCDTNLLYRPHGTMYGNPAPLDPSFCPLSMLFSDWGRQGRQDLRISNDRHYFVNNGNEQLWRMTTTPSLFTQAEGWMEHKLWGMGIASRDLDGDGLPEVMLSSMGDQRLQQLKSQDAPTFVDVPFDRGTTAQRPYTGGDGRPSTGWHISFGDVQNDGRDDIFIAKGNVEQMPGLAQRDPNNLLIQNDNGTFAEVGETAGLANFHRGRGAAMADLNRDGLLDIVVVNRRAPFEVYQNKTESTGNWIALHVTQEALNRTALGAWIEMVAGDKRVFRELTVGGGHASGQMSGEHFGLGHVKEIHVRVIWPDQQVSPWATLAPNQSWSLNRSEAGTFYADPY